MTRPETRVEESDRLDVRSDGSVGHEFGPPN